LIHTDSAHSRRKFLLNSSAASLTAFLPKVLDAQSAAPHRSEEDSPVYGATPKDASLKFTPEGVRKPFAGNTLICHLPQQSRLRDKTVALGEALRSASFAYKLGVLPGDSYHMTVFPGANDQDRAAYGWPADLPLDAPMSECNRIVGERIAAFRMREKLPIRVRVDLEKTLGPQRASSLRLLPTDDRENTKLRNLRDRMAEEVFRFRTPDHATYGFHLSLAYQMKPLSQEEEREHQDILKHHVPGIIAAAPVIELGVPEFCTFEDMFRFEICALLQT
jgi:hypothetical protein